MLKPIFNKKSGVRVATVASIIAGVGVGMAKGADAPDPLLDLFVKKGLVTQEEADKVKAEADAMRTNEVAAIDSASRWKISKGLKNIGLYGDIRVRYEDRTAEDPTGGKIDLNRLRAAVRIGLKGEAYDDFYYGVRLDTSANPRSAWYTFGSSSSGSPYQGPFGKSTAGINVGQVYLGWHPTSWLDLTAGKMPMPLYTTPMVWDSDYNPEGLAEHLKYTVGPADLFGNFTQFIYQDLNPTTASGGLGINGLTGQNSQDIFQFAWQGGVNYRITTNISAKVGATIYKYVGMKRSTSTSGTTTSPGFGDPFVGEGTYLGPGTGTHNGASGFGTSSTLPGHESLGFPNNQVGLDHLTVLEIPFEANFKICKLDARMFGDFAYNFEGKERAQAAANGYQAFLNNQTTTPTVTGFKAQTDDVKAYQIGLAIASHDNIGLTYGSVSHRHGWEARAYWQHVEQYALDPNLLDSDFFEGRGNLEGFYAAVAYGLTDNVIATFRYGYATRINDKLGTGGSNQDIPQINPIHKFNLLQMDLTLRF
ncbi:MAG TPA: putative porin [Verrucomicrobiae bacterium]|jgi:hypothetical protein